jgi:hypothetical protein
VLIDCWHKEARKDCHLRMDVGSKRKEKQYRWRKLSNYINFVASSAEIRFVVS